MTDKEILEEIEYNVLNDPFTTFSQDSSYESVQIKATAIEELVKRFKKQQKEIKARLEEIDSLYKMMSVKDEKILELRHFKNEVNDIIEDAYYTAEPTYWNIKNLLEGYKEDE